MRNQRVLIINYYCPPSGELGVQRWLKLARHLSLHNITPIILTVDETYASYGEIGGDLIDDTSFEKTNMVYVSNIHEDSFTKRLMSAIRKVFSIPSPGRNWNKFAYKNAEEIILREKIDLVITSCPSYYSQLIGLRLKEKLGVKWIADFRDAEAADRSSRFSRYFSLLESVNRSYKWRILTMADEVLISGENLKSLSRKSQAEEVRRMTDKLSEAA